MTILLINFKCAGNSLHVIIYYRSWCLYGSRLVKTNVHDKKTIAGLVMISFRWLMYGITTFLQPITDRVMILDTEIENLVFWCSFDDGRKDCFSLVGLIDLQVGTISILKFLDLVFEYG